MARDMARIVDRIEREGECWIWQGSLDRAGYGLLKHQGQPERAHRYAFRASGGSVRGGLHVLHSCDRPSCVNPDHLRAGTPADNAADRQSRGRGGHLRGVASPSAKLTEDDVRRIREAFEKHGCSEAGRMFGISPQHAWSIGKRKIWKDVA